MKIHTGKPKHKGEISFTVDGYYFKDTDDKQFRFVRYPSPVTKKYKILSMWGVSFCYRFFGVMRFTKDN